MYNLKVNESLRVLTFSIDVIELIHAQALFRDANKNIVMTAIDVTRNSNL